MKLSEFKKMIREEIKSILSEARKPSGKTLRDLETVKRIMEEYTKKKIIVTSKLGGEDKGQVTDFCRVYVTPSSSFYKAGKEPVKIDVGDRDLPKILIVYDKFKRSFGEENTAVDLPGLWTAVGALWGPNIPRTVETGFMIGWGYLAVDDVENEEDPEEEHDKDSVYYKGGPKKMWWLRTW